MQDQAFLGPESCLAEPDGDGGIHLRCSTQWLHVDRDQLARVLALDPERLRLTLAGVGGAFGGREDLSVQAHASLLALRTGRPVTMNYPRGESFVGHVHRHPARMRYTHTATRDGRLLAVEADILLDGGAYASTSPAVVGNAGCFAAGPYAVPAVHVDAEVVYTTNPPCGAMRGFGAIQVCFAYESQMDRLAHALGLDPVELRRRNAVTTGSTMATGQRVHGPAPVAELLDRVTARPPAPARTDRDDEETVRGVGYALSIKNICKSAGVDDFGTARVRLFRGPSDQPVAEVHTAAAEVGQGLVTVQQQIARSELGVDRVEVAPADTTVGDAGTSSASRQTWISGGAVQQACRRVRDEVLERAAARIGVPAGSLRLHAGASRLMIRIALLATGGTIATRTTGSGRAVSATALELLEATGTPRPEVTVEPVDVAARLSSAMSLDDLTALARTVARYAMRGEAVVLTHGTDTLEETAFLLALTHAHAVPVVLTGAQRPLDDPDSDGPDNLALALRWAALGHPGVAVAFAGEVWSAIGVRKCHTTADHAFAVPDATPLAVDTDAGLRVTRPPATPPPLALPARLPRVDVVVQYVGADTAALDAALAADAAGIVIAAFGLGNATPNLTCRATKLLGQRYPVAVSTRVPAGPVQGLYTGAGAALAKAGALMVPTLTPWQTRLLLATALGPAHEDAIVAARSWYTSMSETSTEIERRTGHGTAGHLT